MAESSDGPLAPWDEHNEAEEEFVMDTPYEEILIQAGVPLSKSLQLEPLWPHLLQLHVLYDEIIERIQFNQPRPDQVRSLLRFVRQGCMWQYHGLMRAMALTGQAALIPKGSLERSVYTKGLDSDEQNEMIIPADQLRSICAHAEFCSRSLMKTHIFDFEGDSGNDFLDVSRCFIEVKPEMEHQPEATEQTSEITQPQATTIHTALLEGNRILEAYGEQDPPRIILLSAHPGVGKTCFAQNLVFKWSKDLLSKIVKENGKIKLNNKSSMWTTMLFIRARDIKDSVEDAICDALGCHEEDTKVLMGHVKKGKGVALFIDAIDELHDEKAMRVLVKYIKDRHKKGGLTVVLTCRKDLCTIDARLFDRFLTLEGFSIEQGIKYVKLYEENFPKSHLLKLAKPPSLSQYIEKHCEKLVPVLTNPLKLYILCGLFMRGVLQLKAGEDLNIPKLLGPLEQYLLTRAGVEVTEIQARNFYRHCLEALLTGVREFPQSMLDKHKVGDAYYVFLDRSNKRGPTGKLEPLYQFGHEMLLEFFASRYIFQMKQAEWMSFFLVMCCEKQFRNVQRILFELILQDGEQCLELLKMILRLMLILQVPAPDGVKIKDKDLREVLKLRDKMKSDIEPKKMIEMLGVDSIRYLHGLEMCDQINDLFNKDPSSLKAINWFTQAKENGVFDHVAQCLLSCPMDICKILVEQSVSRILPGTYKKNYYTYVSVYPTSSGWWGEVNMERGTVQLDTRSPSDAEEVLVQHLMHFPNAAKAIPFHIETNHSLYPHLTDSPSQRTTSHCSLLKTISRLAANLAQVRVKGGSVDLGSLLDCINQCRQSGVTVDLQDVDILAPGGSTGPVDQMNLIYLARSGVRFNLLDTSSICQQITFLMKYSTQLALLKKVELWYGSAEVEDLLTSVINCRKAGVNVELQEARVVIPNSSDTDGSLWNAKIGEWTPSFMMVLAFEAELSDVFACLSKHAADLKDNQRIFIQNGRAHMTKLALAVQKCKLQGLNIELWRTSIFVPADVTNDPERFHKLHKELKVTCKVKDAGRGRPFWITESGKEFIGQGMAPDLRITGYESD